MDWNVIAWKRVRSGEERHDTHVVPSTLFPVHWVNGSISTVGRVSRDIIVLVVATSYVSSESNQMPACNSNLPPRELRFSKLGSVWLRVGNFALETIHIHYQKR